MLWYNRICLYSSQPERKRRTEDLHMGRIQKTISPPEFLLVSLSLQNSGNSFPNEHILTQIRSGKDDQSLNISHTLCVNVCVFPKSFHYSTFSLKIGSSGRTGLLSPLGYACLAFSSNFDMPSKLPKEHSVSPSMVPLSWIHSHWICPLDSELKAWFQKHKKI